MGDHRVHPVVLHHHQRLIKLSNQLGKDPQPIEAKVIRRRLQHLPGGHPPAEALRLNPLRLEKPL